MKKLIKKENLFTIIYVLIALHPLYELDYLIEDVIHLRITTVINFLIYPLLALLAFIFYEKKKKRVLVLGFVYLALLIIYFIPHCMVGFYLQDNIHLTNLYYFTVYDEFFYIFTLLLPLFFIYAYSLTELKETIIEAVASTMSFVIAIPIVVSNYFKVGLTTYEVEYAGNFIDWFSMPFNATTNHPRNYATKFFFKEGNTIGIILVMLLPFMYYFFLKEKDLKKKIGIAILILFDSLAMMIIGTRVAAYCAVLIPLTVLIVHIFTSIIKTCIFNKTFTVFCVILTLMNAFVLKYSPAYQNQQYDAADFTTLQSEEYRRASINREVINKDTNGMEPFSEEWVNYYVYAFEQYKDLMGVTQSVYYEYWYDYHIDPKFWLDLILDYELEDRINARQIEKIFYDYKWQYLTKTQKLTGLTYGLFMRGGINIEQDFILQAYSFGYLGFPLIMGPLIGLLLYVVYKFLRGFKNKWNMFNIICMMSLALAIVTSFLSGHGLDQISSNMFMGLIIAFLIQDLKGENNGRA